MNVWFVWQNCPLSMHNGSWANDPIDSFWISASEEEARKFFYDHLTDEEKEEFEKAVENQDYLDGWYRGHREGSETEPDDDFRFLVARDMSRISLGFAVYPYSGMWNGDCPFIDVFCYIASPEELKDI